ncbi:MAG: single-stranded-DNA-specific exonuclease RecJ [Candidatus Omnitrophica bacterium]|nr:single-stranded-DNA-specific exonuclease RecJ [Candidatus Omnitrophota bacterium]MDD5592345.1 single-stranded-DNA-specific exonuclease RecJ [Candidatus Omnitrophota bacterium]
MQNHKILKVAPADTRLQGIFSKELGISKILSQLLINRGINTKEEAGKFLGAGLEYLLDPYSFSDMRRAVRLIKDTAKDRQKIMVFGDYDVDGLTAITLLKGTLSEMGINASHYIPHRIKEGYGLNKNILHCAKEKRVKLLITVDCGTNNHEQIKELQHYGINVIVTDHHEPDKAGALPDGCALINPKIKNAGYKYRDLAGVGVAYKLCQALTAKTLPEELDLVCLGTIADVAPLTGENRIMVKEGLARLGRTKRPGLKALTEISGIKGKKITSRFVGYILGPRINASGRMDTAETALDLLMSVKQEEADKLAKIIETHNRQRQKIEGKISEEAQDLIGREVNFKEHKIIVIAKENWHQGVLGIVASKLADKFYRPTIVISLTEDLCKGSGRSIKNFHLFEALLECREFLQNFGGHSHAVGLMIARDNIEEFRKKINRLAKEKLLLEDLLPTLEVDMELKLADLNEEIIRELESLEPFGAGNPEPLFYTRNLKLKGEPQVLGRDTLKFWVTDGEVTSEAIGFGMAGFKESFTEAHFFDLVYKPKIDDWRGEETVLLEVEDVFFN